MRHVLNTLWRTARPFLLATGVGLVAVSVCLLRIENRAILAAATGAVAFFAVYRWARSSLRLQDLSAELAGLVDTVAVPMLQTDHRGVVTVWNHAAEEALGAERAGVVGFSFHDLIASSPTLDERGKQQLLSWFEAAEAGEAGAFDMPIDAPTGGRVLRVYLSPRRDRWDRLRGVVGVGLDMTAEFDADEARAQTMAMERASQLKDEFLAAMSHELRTPLTAILGLSQIMQRTETGRLNQQQLEYLREIEKSGQHLLSLINDILDLAKIGSGNQDIGGDAVDLGTVVAEAVTMVRSTAERKGLIIDVSRPPDPVAVTGDERRLKQIVLNLLSNAVKFTEAGTVGIEWATQTDVVAFTVWDTGPGIPAEKRTLLFQPFQQVDGRLARQHGGTGLGLALTKELVELHGGTIAVESTPGAGARFTVELPRIHATHVPAAATAAPPVDEALPPLDLDVLIAEDDPIAQMMLGDALRAAGAYVHIAGDGAEAVRLAPIIQPTVILMDIQMPVMDGLEATRRLKADPATRDIPVLAVSALAMTGDRERILEAGCDGYLAKPVDPAQLLQLVALMARERVELT